MFITSDLEFFATQKFVFELAILLTPVCNAFVNSLKYTKLLQVDFNKWVDEDDVAEDAGFDFSNMNFPGGEDMFGGGGMGLGNDDDGKRV